MLLKKSHRKKYQSTYNLAIKTNEKNKTQYRKTYKTLMYILEYSRGELRRAFLLQVMMSSEQCYMHKL